MGEIIRDNFAPLLEPGLRAIFMNEFARDEMQFKQIVNIQNSSKAIETDLRMSGFGPWLSKGTLDSTKYQQPGENLKVQYIHETFSSGFMIEKEMVDDEQYSQINKFPKELALQGRLKIETDVASLLNSAFTPNPMAVNGEALIANDHKLPTVSKGVRSNFLGNYALNEQSLELANAFTAQQKTDNGDKAVLNFDTLVVPRELEMTARRLLESTAIPDANSTGKTYALNDINPIRGKYKLVVLDYLTDPTAWFLMASRQHQLNFFWREKVNFKSMNDFDTDVAKYKGRMRYSFGWTSDLGIIGARP